MTLFTPYIEITTSSFCSNNCSFCPQKLFLTAYASKLQKADRLMSMETFQKAVSWAPPGFYIYFSGFSEPFMNPLCTEMILYAHKHKRHVGLFTTLMGATMKDIKKILTTLTIRPGEDGLIIHLPSENKIENIIVTGDYLQMLKYILSISGDNIELHYHGYNLRKEVKEVVTSLKRKVHFVKLVSRPGTIKLPNESLRKRLRGCIGCKRLGMHEHVILPDGTVVLCCNDFGMKHVLGNIYKEDYESVRNSKEMKRILRGFDNENIDILCRNCNSAINQADRLAYLKTPFSLEKMREHLKLLSLIKEMKN
jgi:radical SAM protein with 4Fe4S-binding SPASM domain